MRRHARWRWSAERPQTKVAIKHPRATGSRTGRVICTNATGGSAGATPDPQLQGRGAEPEVLADAAFEVAQVGRWQRPAGEQGERGRIGGALGGVQDPARRRGMGGLGRLEDLV